MKLYLIDANAYVHRAFYALPPLSRKDGFPVGAIHGFIDMMLWLMDGPHSDHTHIAAVLDAGRSGREQEYTGYKANRSARPEPLLKQLPIIPRACEAIGLPVLKVPGFEADDVIATYAKACEAAGGECRIYSSDKDLMQLLSDKVQMYDPMTREMIGPEKVAKAWNGLPPNLIADMLGLMGDAVDNIPGVSGVGEKGAAKLLLAHGSLDGVIQAALEGRAATTAKIAANIVQEQDAARLSKALAELKRDVCEPEFGAVQRIERDYRKALDFCDEFEFEQIAERLMAA